MVKDVRIFPVTRLKHCVVNKMRCTVGVIVEKEFVCDIVIYFIIQPDLFQVPILC